MKKFLILWGSVAAVVASVALAMPVQAAGLNNFTITNFKIDYSLSRDDTGRSVLKTTETITADFPQRNTNHGLERAIPTKYDGHPVRLSIDAVTDVSGKSLPYSRSDSSGNAVLRIGDADRYVYGQQTYVISYTRHDVTKTYADTGKDEFYWDTNGTQWQVPIQQLSVTLRLDDATAQAYRQGVCYSGAQGASDTCELARDSATLTVQAVSLAPGENVTLALGFAPQTFTAYEPSAIEKFIQQYAWIWVLLLIVTSIGSIALIIIMSIRWYHASNRKRDMGAVVAEYLPPSYSVLTTARVAGGTGSVLAAQLIDLAVRHYVRIYETKPKTTFRVAQYRIELMKAIDDLSTEEQALLRIFFPNATTGETFDMKKLARSVSYGRSLQLVVGSKYEDIYELRAKVPAASKSFRRVAWVALVIAILTLSPFLFTASMVVFILAATLKPLTDAGLALRRYALGLKLYIGVAEKDRLAMLQSPEGAEKTGVTLNDGQSAELVKLYERVLPYAVLFRQETEWSKQLGEYYESTQQQPGWYSGTDVFSAAMLGSAIQSFSSAATPYTSSSSSSSGGSSGGGFSGGGGGGGGGGGW